MTRTNRRLELALFLSLTVHLLPFLPGLVKPRPPIRPSPPPPLSAHLQPPPQPAPELIIPKTISDARPRPAPPQKKSPPSTPGVHWESVARKQLRDMKASGLYYSREAIAQGLEGEVLVLFALDAEGNVTAAGIRESSGAALLDRDAVAAIKRLRALPADAPREGLYRLRFRLKESATSP